MAGSDENKDPFGFGESPQTDAADAEQDFLVPDADELADLMADDAGDAEASAPPDDADAAAEDVAAGDADEANDEAATDTGNADAASGDDAPAAAASDAGPSVPPPSPDLDDLAMAAAQAAIAAGEAEVSEAEAALADEERARHERLEDAQDDAEATAAAARRDRAIRWLLGCNVVLMGVMLALPTPGDTAPTPAPATGNETGTEPTPPASSGGGDTFEAQRRVLGLRMTIDEVYDQAYRLVRQGDHEGAIALFAAYLQRNPEIPDVEKRMAYSAMGTWAARAGNLDLAAEYEVKLDQLRSKSFLPEDLIRGARTAEEAGQNARMRSNYARFLLMQRQLPTRLRMHIAEAYLKMGDSYRLDAEGGQRAAEADAETSAQDRLKLILRGTDGAGEEKK